MIKLTIISPGETVKAGQSGSVHATIEHGLFVVPSYMMASIVDATGNEVWANQGDVLNDETAMSLTWPPNPGTYRVEVKCYGPLTEIVSVVQEFVVTS